MKSIILIPAYKPDHKFVDFTGVLISRGFTVVAVDDGSGQDYAGCFEDAKNLGVNVISYETNRGKGRALKTGIKYIIENFADTDFVVTADCDGQHTPDDIEKVIEAGELNKNHIIIGGRFSRKDDDVPTRSIIGNTITRYIFKIVTGLSIRDTQTGLRGIPKNLLTRLVDLKGERYEYEMNMLLYLKEWSVPFVEIPISTIYFNNNKGSHYNTLKDTWRIFKQIIKFALVAILSLLIDYGLFKVFYTLGFGEFTSYVMARIISSIFNFIANSRYVFKTQGYKVIAKYYLLALCIMLIGASGTKLITQILGLPGLISKLCVDLPLFFASYVAQREFVYKKRIGEKGK